FAATVAEDLDSRQAGGLLPRAAVLQGDVFDGDVVRLRFAVALSDRQAVVVADEVGVDRPAAIDADVMRIVLLADPNDPASMVFHVANLALDAVVDVSEAVHREPRPPYARRDQDDRTG